MHSSEAPPAERVASGSPLEGGSLSIVLVLSEAVLVIDSSNISEPTITSTSTAASG